MPPTATFYFVFQMPAVQYLARHFVFVLFPSRVHLPLRRWSCMHSGLPCARLLALCVYTAGPDSSCERDGHMHANFMIYARHTSTVRTAPTQPGDVAKTCRYLHDATLTHLPLVHVSFGFSRVRPVHVADGASPTQSSDRLSL